MNQKGNAERGKRTLQLKTEKEMDRMLEKVA